ncbi:uncharacterized protein LOC113556330 isoform X2 [Rhopalosiphum maidis]|uniref:uncharacterized protein LOC113556330 isoform X2 n=1 Tax=Rhopalosiphum maidis TaxID=43146 RepID=UPI000EFFA5F5|nr:uncharacterized protein LOC113556330 isoform X2 [Rhopalosiphum maidis]
MAITMSLEPAMVGERRLKSNQVARVVRKSHDDYHRSCGTSPFVGCDSDRYNYCQRDIDGVDQTSAVLEGMRPPVQRDNIGGGAVHHRVTCNNGEKPGNVEVPVDWAKPRVTGDADPNIGDADGYHPVRRRLVADCERDEIVTVAPAAADDVSPEDQRRWLDDCKQQWFGNCWRPKPSFAVTDIHQHHHRRVHRHHRHHHHHTHHLHMWTSSCCWWLLVFYAVVVVIASFARAAHSAKDVPVYHVRAVAGQQARLPCDISLVSDEEDDLSDPGADSPPLDGESSLASGANLRDAVLLVLWYRDDLGTPIYSVDARSTSHQPYDSTSYHLMTTGAERWSDQRVFGDRAHFHVNAGTTEEEVKSKINNQKKSTVSTYYSSELRIDRVSVKDAIHLYRCRVDFRLAQTRNSKVNLTVIVPPDRMEIMDLATGRQLLRRQDGDSVNSKNDRGSEASTTTTTTVVGPYVEGSDVRVRCRVYGGKPRPRVAWFRDNRLLKPESDDPDNINGAQQQDVTAIDGYATATVTSSSSTSTGGDNSEGILEVDLTLTGLTRSDLHTELTCRVWNYFYDDEEYSIIVTNSGSSNIDTNIEKENMSGEVDPSRWTLRQRQSSLTAVVHVDMNFPPLTVQILPIAENGHLSGIDNDLQPPPFTQSSAKMTPLTLPEDDDRLSVHSSKIQEQRQLQPLTAGRKYELPCRAYGSRPPAKLTWWMDGRRLDTTRETTSTDGNSTTSVLTFVPVKPTTKSRYREPGEADEHRTPDYDGRLTCRAENPQHQLSTSQRKHTIAAGSDSSDDAGTPFIQSTWLLRIQYVPETQITLGTNLRADDIREGTDVYFDCTVDAVPPAYKVQWKRDGVELHHNAGGSGSITGSGSTTTIIISNQSLVLQGVSRRESGHYTCGAENAEGPGPHSKSIHLDVLYAPTCTPSNSAGKAVQRVVYGVAKKETVTIACHVQANPPPTEYRWSFNNTISSIATGGGAGSTSTGSLIKQRFSSIGNLAGSSLNSSRILTYAPRTDFDYGTVECWARNRVGMQAHPCVYHVIAAGRPDRVTNCTVVNSRAAMNLNGTRRLRSSKNSGSHIFIRCTEGYDGGLPQRLWAEIREDSKVQHSDLGGDDLGGDLVLNITGIDEQDQPGFSDLNSDENKRSENPASPPVKVFVARGLKLGAVYRVDVMASNAKGRSEPLTLMISIPMGMTTVDSNEQNQNGISNTMTTIEGQDPDRARNLLLEQQREQERDRRLQENGGGVGDFRMTRAMAIVLLVAGSLVVVACGAATFLRYRRDDDDGDDNDEDDRDNGRGSERTIVDASTVCIAGPGNKPDGPVHCQPANVDGCAVPANGAMPSNNNGGANFGNGNSNGGKNTTAADNGKEFHCGNVVGGRVVGGLQRICSNTIGRSTPIGAPCADGGGSQQDVVSGAPIALVPPSRASPTTLLRGTPSSNNAHQPSYGATCKPSLQQKMSMSSSAANDQPGPGRIPQSYHSKNPDIIPAPLMSPGNVYNNYNSDHGDPVDSMTLIMASSTSSSPIHNHRQQQVHQHNRYNNPAGQYHSGVMTLRRPVVINTQYYGGGGGGGNLQRNNQQPPDPIVMVKGGVSSGAVNYPTTTSSAAAYCTLPRSSYHHHHQHHQNHNLHNHPHHHQQQQQHWHQQQQQQLQQQQQQHQLPADLEVDVVEPPPPPWPPHNLAGAYPATVIVVPSPPLPSPPVQQSTPTAAVIVPAPDKLQTVNKRESAV